VATATQIQEHYDSLALIYRTYWGDHIHHGLFLEGDETAEEAQVKMLDHCTQLLNLRGGEKVLDAGCGHGGTLLHLARKLNCSGTGLTISAKQARLAGENVARSGFKEQLMFLVENIDTFEFPASAFDVVWAMESSEHFSDKSNFFRNVSRALRPGGRLLLAAWTGPMDRPRVREVARAFLCPELWTAERYRMAIDSCDMKVVRCEDLTAQVIRTWEICRKHAQLAGPIIRLLPQSAREFVEGVDIILDAYRSGDLTYTAIVAERPIVP
jgi:cyclopropane fatty-acyl-phospholipid synthase-like methyltransferase